MNISRLDHVNLRTDKLEEMITWYEEILGFEKGPRPNFAFPGAWMYRCGSPLVHLVEVAGPLPSHDNLALEHAAFTSSGLAKFVEHLSEKSIYFEKAVIEDFGIIQINVWDPQGNHLHIDFSMDEVAK